MSFAGMGPMEIIVIMLLAFIVLGPKRMMEAARLLGKAVREMRRMSASMQDLVLDEDSIESTVSSTPRRAVSPSRPEAKEDGGAAGEPSEADDGPVPFRPEGQTSDGVETGSQSDQNRT